MTKSILIRGEKVYVQGSVNGKFYRKSTGKRVGDKDYLKYLERNHRDVLLKLIDKEKPKLSKNFIEFGKQVIQTLNPSEEVKRDYIRIFEKHVAPTFKNYSLEEITATHIDLWQSAMLQKYSADRVRRAKNIFNRILKKAVANRLIDFNPATFTEKVLTPERDIQEGKHQPYTVEEMRAIIQNTVGWLHVFFLLAFTTGMRTGELLGLRWEDFNFQHNIIQLKRSYTKGKESKSSKQKNHKRIVPLLSFVKEAVQNYKTECKSEAWVFPSNSGKPYYDTKSIKKYQVIPLFKKLGIDPKKTLYATRHTFSSLAIKEINPYVVSSIIGHSRSETTEKFYAQYTHDSIIGEHVNNIFEKHLIQVN